MSNLQIESFIEMMLVERGASKNTLEAYERDLADFALFCNQKYHKYSNSKNPNNFNLQNATKEQIESFLLYLNGQSFSTSTIARKLSAIKQFYYFLVSDGEIIIDPTTHVTIAIQPSKLPKFLTEEEVEHLLYYSKSDETKEGRRLHALLEILYASGVRASELIGLKKSSIQYVEKGKKTIFYLKITGKGNKERIVPLNENSVNAINVHIDSMNVAEKSSEFLFPSNSKKQHLTRQRFGQLIKKLAQSAGINPNKVSPHVIRHSFASHLLNRGIDLRTLQTILGHEDISTTQIYTHIPSKMLIEEINQKHPLVGRKIKDL